MKSIFAAEVRSELHERVDRLSPERPAQWGTMTCHRMVCHLIDAFAVFSGDRPTPRAPFLIRLIGPLVKGRVLSRPWPKGRVKAPPESFVVQPGNWDSQVAEVHAGIERWAAPLAQFPPHPFFGRMNDKQWGVLMYRHMDHHLTQFGV